MDEEQLKKVLEMIKGLTKKTFYGKLVITFNAGKIVHVKKEESIPLK